MSEFGLYTPPTTHQYLNLSSWDREEAKLKKDKTQPVQQPPWFEIELQVYALKHLKLPPEEKLRRAAHLAAIYREYNRPLPDELAILV